MSNHHLVSVIIPVYNGERYLSEAIQSVIEQTYEPIEIILVDDGSTDNTAQVAKQFQQNIHYVYQPNSGAPSARNTGLKIAVGNIIAFLDADDMWNSNKLEIQINHLTKNPLTEIVLGYQQVIYISEIIEGKPKFQNYSTPEMALQLGTAVFRKSVFEKVGLFNPELRYADDWDWFMRAREMEVLMMIHSETVLFYRRHDHNLTNQRELDNKYTIKMLKKSLDRRRNKNHGLATSLPKLAQFQEESPTN